MDSIMHDRNFLFFAAAGTVWALISGADILAHAIAGKKMPGVHIGPLRLLALVAFGLSFAGITLVVFGHTNDRLWLYAFWACCAYAALCANLAAYLLFSNKKWL